MKKITFTQNREFDYGHGAVMHKAGDTVAVHEGGANAVMSGERLVSIRRDKAERWLTRGAAEVAHDKPVESPADVAGADSGGAGERPVDVAEPGAVAAKPAGRGRK